MKKLLMFLAVLVCFYIIGSSLQKVSWLPFGNNGTQAASMENIDMIAINASAADVTVIPENRKDVKANYSGRGKVKVTKNGDIVKVSLERSWLGGFNFWDKKKLKIYIPKNFNEKMAVNVGSGRFHFSGSSKRHPMNLKDLSIDMTSGLVELKNLSVQSFKHKGSSGNAQFHYLKADKANIKMSSGIVDLNHYQGQLNARLSSGKLKAQFDQLDDPIDIKMSSGILKLDLPEDADFSLDGNVGSGIISCKIPLKDESRSGKNIRGSYGSGKNKIYVKVSSGMATIY
ncbi:DUF4097 domain-containing protein [Bacillus sp. FJAT-49736]|uniref:LiaG family protein n=1 Tax=Bacillus sp. FJAT-49736 TaxID=2833582 RepID=UPI001BCA4568|nr:DUF4097 domain-containing protein [Bacillus sp. FJAT-49736]MBS4174459.1 DUF4097 domain-containing protein [Bacillus sp. FJAT-49736]MBS4175816.1 DUF4097 domain-containing protein [Bacillus sp. FJAT-49736]